MGKVERSVHAASNSGHSNVDGQRYEFDQVGIGSSVWVRGRQGLAVFQPTLSEIFRGRGDHQPGIGQIEALCDSSWKIEGIRDHHFAGRAWKVEGNVVAEHTPIILQMYEFGCSLKPLPPPRANTA